MPPPSPFPPPPPTGAGRLRIGYLSADFHRHATAFLTAGLFERHDRARFEVAAYSTGPDDGSPMRARLERAFERFVDLRGRPARAMAERIRADGIDILVDLKGYTAGAQTAVLAARPAPLQVSWLGYPGTMGAAFIDYLVADAVVAPPDQASHYSERLVWLPHSYQVNDRARPIAAATPTRAECGLPAEGMVFCCFNNAYKILPATWGLWMELLRAVPGAVLWLLDGPAAPALRREAEARGVAATRLVFAPRRDLAEHLARHRLADLFLDTLPYNAHTTASDALWAGLPVLTCAGPTFAGRVGASLLRAAGLPELVTDSPQAYRALALRLAADPALLAGLRRRLVAGRDSAPLFDTDGFTRALERAFVLMWQRRRAGLAPASFLVEEVFQAAAKNHRPTPR